MNARRVSVVVPTCDRPKSLRRALESIRALDGPDLAFEILVADNGKCNETRKVADQFGAVYLTVARKGPSEARNAAMSAATGDYIAFLDDDDVFLEGHIRPHLQLFEQNPSLDLVIGQVVSCDEQYVQFGDPWLAEFPKTAPDLLRRMLSGYFPQVGSLLARARVRDNVGGFDPRLTGGEDLDWLLRIAARGNVGFAQVPCVMFTHRAIGTFDALQLRRVKFDRLVFNRYAWRWLHLWRSPMEFMRAYSGTVMHYYRYFVDAALERAERGERGPAMQAAWQAIRIFPFRAAKHLTSDTRLRHAVVTALFARTPVEQMHHLPLWLFVAHC